MFIVVDADGRVRSHSLTPLEAGDGERLIQAQPDEWAALEATGAAVRETATALAAAQAAYQRATSENAAAQAAYREASDGAREAFREADGLAAERQGAIVYREQEGRFAVVTREPTEAERAKAADMAVIAARAKDDPAFAAMARALGVLAPKG